MSVDTDNWHILGHQWAVDLLRLQLQNNRAHHAYLITGPQGVGRRTLALRLAQAVNCPEPVSPGVPCGACRACRLIFKMQHPDLLIVKSEAEGKSIKVDQIRALQRNLAYAPYEARRKIALVLNFEDANPNAANALLKTLEEPPSQVILLLTASDAEALLPTIRSRCEIIRLRPLTLEETVAGLQSAWDIPTDQAHLLAHISGGRPGIALHLHQHPEFLEQRSSRLDEHFQLLSASRTARFHFAEELAKNKPDLQDTLQTWLTLWRDILLCAAASTAPLTNIDREAEIQTLAARLSLAAARETVENIERTLSLVDRYINARLALEVLLLDIPRIPTS